MKEAAILVVEDDPAAARYMVLTLEEHFTDVRTVPTCADALRAVASKPPALVFLDLHLPDMDGRELLTLIKESHRDIPVIMVTASDDVRHLGKVLLAGRALAGGGRIEARHLALLASVPSGAIPGSADSAKTLKDMQRDGIVRALHDAGGNRSRAAGELGIDRSTLRRKLIWNDPLSSPGGGDCDPAGGPARVGFIEKSQPTDEQRGRFDDESL